jgi:hypothetical protein
LNTSDAMRADKRPHQLFLTGDQIYADDVADAMLHMIIDADKYLIDRAETLPSVAADPPLPGKRSSIMRGTAKFTSGVKESKSHLIKLNEFYCMYLFAWSPVLWPTTLPDFATVRPGEATYTNAGNGSAGYSPDYAAFLREIGWLNTFKSTLANVRKALANVPVYMIFDDHEITDDWFLNRSWVNKVYASGLGKRVIANGLAAYAAFQDWGNLYLRYYSAIYPGYNLLNLLKVSTINFGSVESLVLPTYNATTKCLEHSGTQPDWNYTVEMGNYEVIVLDSRTFREFPTLYHNAALISDASMANQIPALSAGAQATVKLTIVIAPSPVFGVPRIDLTQSVLSGNSESGTIEYDVEGWGLRQRENDTLQYLLSRLTGRANNGSPRRGRVVLLSGDVHYSSSQRVEFWATKLANQPVNSTFNFNLIVAQCTASSSKNEVRSATGSYNVHYLGYKIPSNNPPGPKKVFGWRTNGTLQVGLHNYVEGMYTSSQTPIVVTKARPILDYDLDVKSQTESQSLRDNYFTVIQTTFLNDFTGGPAPDWVYRVDYIKDVTAELRPSTDYSKDFVASPPYADRATALAAYLEQAKNEKKYITMFKAGKEIVGKNNMGELSFELDAGGNLKTAVHALWWQLRSSAGSNAFLGLFPLTLHKISLEFANPSYPKPSL